MDRPSNKNIAKLVCLAQYVSVSYVDISTNAPESSTSDIIALPRLES